MAIQVERARRLFTVEEYDRMAEAAVFGPEERVELIEGEIVQMSPIGDRHAAFVDNLTRLLITRVGSRAVVRVQGPVRVSSRSKPQPDLLLMRPRSYASAGARTDDVLLLVEVADSSLAYDRTVKLRVYARAGIPEYWIVDTEAETVDVYREPTADGYRAALRVGRDGVVAPLAFSDVAVPVNDIFA
jgi:Uma2 family endonuclease